MVIGLTRPSQLLDISLTPECFKRMGREKYRSKAKVVFAAEVRGLAV